MDELLTFILTGITGKDVTYTKFEEEDRVVYEVTPETTDMGLIIGKEGRTVKAIQDILRVRARLENKFVSVRVIDSASQTE
jgi:uncharacterized protein